MSWQDDAKSIPLWPGARVIFRVIDGVDDGCFVDLADPDTFRGAVARLALKLGAPEEAVMVGVQFNRNGGNTSTLWTLFAGGRPEWDAKDPRYWEGACLISNTTDPREALAAWWKATGE